MGKVFIRNDFESNPRLCSRIAPVHLRILDPWYKYMGLSRVIMPTQCALL